MANTASGKPNPFVPARKERSKLRLLLTGPSGSGKTWTALEIAYRLADLEKGKVAFVDTEGRSASKYADHFAFDVLDLSNNYDPRLYVAAIDRAAEYQYPVLVTDSFSHAWNGAGGVLEIVDEAGKKMGGNDWAGWSKGRPAQNQLVNAIVTAPIHLIGTARSKTEWAIDETPGRKTKPRKIGTSPVQSADFEYEFDIACLIDMDHVLTITKSRCQKLPVDMEIKDIDWFVTTLYEWLNDGIEPQQRPAQPVQQQNAQPPATTNFEDARNRLGASSAANADGERRIGGEQEGQQGKPAPHWATIPENQKWLTDLVASLGLKASEVIGKLEQGKTLNRWTETSLTKEQTEARLRQIANTPAQPQKPAPPVKTILTPDNESDQVDGWIWDSFQRPSADFMEELKIDAWAGKYKTVEDAREATIAIARSKGWPMVAREVEYIERGSQKYLEFKAPNPIRAYGRSSNFKTLVDQVNPQWYELNKLATIQIGQTQKVDPILITWEQKGEGNSAYLVLTGIEMIDTGDNSPEGEPDPEALIDELFFGEPKAGIHT